jgi:hypothetical protein
LEERINKLYKLFKGLPNGNPIVRNNQPNDAFCIYVFETLFSNLHGYDDLSVENLNVLNQSIVPPPDNGIDIFIEHIDGDEYFYHVVQVKNTDLAEHEIRNCFALMERTISDYLKSPRNVHKNLRTIISGTEFDETVSNDNIYYYVVHKGSVNFIKNLRKNERIITSTELKILKGSKSVDCVPFESFKADNSNNFILYKYEDNIPSKPRAMLCNLNGFELAQFSNKYINTELGRNILFGQNLRESLNRKSKTFKAMTETIEDDPEKFWYYNNGITINEQKH